MWLYCEYPQGLKEQAKPPEPAAQQRIPAVSSVAMMSVGGKGGLVCRMFPQLLPRNILVGLNLFLFFQQMPKYCVNDIRK